MDGTNGARRIRVRGQVQGVGFRPFVWQLARRFGLRGHVLNDAEGVLIAVAGDRIGAFQTALRHEAPPLARIDAIEAEGWDGTGAENPFVIRESGPAGAETRVTPDAATCPACLAEIADPGGRRHGYAFTNCTHCGPRFTIVTGLPYDRARTTMAPFALCPACAAEYADPADRRFHAQPIACPDCGPRLSFETLGKTAPPAAGMPLAQAAELLLSGGIAGVKGLGGVHLACLARDGAAIERLRTRKKRPAKPLAMMGTEPMIAAHANPSPAEWARLHDPAAPIVLLAATGTPLPDAVAPGMAEHGWMLPYTPLHHLLLALVDAPLVMTSANTAGAPQVIGRVEAKIRLSGIADALLLHDREIARRLDDSVERETPHGPMILRRARGRAPGTLPLPPGFEDAPPVLAHGGQMKAALCLTKNGQALLSHHLGELDEAQTWEAYLAAEEDYRALFDHAPELHACDAHEGYRATQHAEAVAGDRPLVRVQHHHAHLASCLGENGWPRDRGPVAGIILDGLGLGPDGTIWGGELLVGDYAGYRRAAHLEPCPLPGGDLAARQPWRNALARLDRAGLAEGADRLFPTQPRDLLRRAIAGGLNAPESSSAGRLFDAVAACLGIVPEAQRYEGEAAMRLEALARRAGPVAPYPMPMSGDRIATGPLFHALAADLGAGRPVAECAAAFQRGLAGAFAAAARGEVTAGRARAVALSGGVFQNPAMLGLTLEALGDVPVMWQTRVPANDGGLALGQALVAAAQGRVG